MTAAIRAPRHVMTVALEDYFQVGAFNKYVQRDQWYRFETRLEKNTVRVLDLLERTNTTATFFVLGWVAKRYPELVRAVADAGHEVAIKGYYHRGVRDMTPAEFMDDCRRAKAVTEAATGRRVAGYRLADGWLTENDLWVLDLLARLGFAYDSSVAAVGRAFKGEPFRRFLHAHKAGDHTLWELPISTARVLGVRVPIAGGNYFRQLPAAISRAAIAKWTREQAVPLVGYFHVWELDPEQPRLTAGSWLTRVRHYRNLDKMEARLEELLRAYPFAAAADVLDIDTRQATPLPAVRQEWAQDTERLTPKVPPAPGGLRLPVSVVVPVYNEELIVPYLRNALHRLRDAMRARYDLTFLIVDDGSTDRTWQSLIEGFSGDPGFDLHRHEANRGVAAAIRTGLLAARTEIVCSMDCDCTYDPLGLAEMIPLLAPGVDLVTASPYHPRGAVRNVPGWRLTLSKGAAWLYRRVLSVQLHTYTSCFRVYRRSSVAPLEATHDRYLGVAELVGRLDLAGGTVVEHPATLEVRTLGRSKMKTVRTILGHLGLMTKFALLRLRRRFRPADRDAVLKSQIRQSAPVVVTAVQEVPPHLLHRNAVLRSQIGAAARRGSE